MCLTTDETYETSGQFGRDRKQLGLVLLNHGLHAAIEDVEVCILRQFQQGYTIGLSTCASGFTRFERLL